MAPRAYCDLSFVDAKTKQPLTSLEDIEWEVPTKKKVEDLLEELTRKFWRAVCEESDTLHCNSKQVHEATSSAVLRQQGFGCCSLLPSPPGP